MNQSPEAKSILQRIQEQISKLSEDSFTQIAIYFGGALLTGFVVKRLGRGVFVLAVATALTIWFLDYVHILSFDMIKFKKLLGFNDQFTTSSFIEQVTFWIKENPLLALAILVGFFLGVQLG